jgi:hypothetical protein
VSRGETPARAEGVTRRRLLLGAGALATAGGAAAAIELTSGSSAATEPGAPALRPVPLGAAPAGRPERQFAWDATLARDADGNPVAPRYDRLLFFDVRGRPSAAHATVLEAALRSLERRFAWGPAGLLFTVGWGPSYFTRALSTDAPIPVARALSDFELPAIDHHDVVLHLAGDDERRLQEVENGLTHGARIDGLEGALDVSPALVWRETRTGFNGAGLPARHQHVGGIPAGRPVPAGAPLFMGFKSNLKRNQATEDAVGIGSGPYADGTTMAVSYMRLRLDSWYEDLDEQGRISRMYAPEVTPREVRHFTTDARSDPGKLGEAIRHRGVIGHSQTTARARRGGRPIILRRDFDTTDGGQAGLHFVSLQRDLADFVRTRTAMNASSAQLQNPAIGDTVNNGINEYMFVLKRGNYIVPPRRSRSFPALTAPRT